MLILVDVHTFSIPYIDASFEPLAIIMRVLMGGCVIVGLLLIMLLFVKKVPVGVLQARRAVDRMKVKERTPWGVIKAYTGNVLSGMTLYIAFMALVNILTVLNPVFAGLLLIDVFRIISTARNIMAAVGKTWRQLFAGCLIFVLMNYVYSFLNYIAYSTLYGPTCNTLYQCFLFLNDTFFKQGPGYMGLLNKDYTQFSINAQFILDVSYIIFVCTVIKEIFSGQLSINSLNCANTNP